ncbi:MAG: isoprenylcysteine carboxylmethyltransferase family protein [Prevotellaceae bacterium]|jgi:protein-S-isoprenylcysteine O-methyltransferase Ste14|nr:isoprenylcysteine carboxylmethyltransferase family protein [Prevotellaceae bacterium]
MELQKEFENQGNWLFRHRGWLPFIILIPGFIFHLHEQSEEQFPQGKPAIWIYYEYLCLLISIIGLAIRIYTIGYAQNNTSGRNTKTQVADSLNIKGIYSIVRHPLYLGNFLMWFGVALLIRDVEFIIAVSAIFCIYYERIMYAEEQFLKKKFDEQFLQWAACTPAFFPRFKQYQRTNGKFNYKKVLKGEKNGLVAIFLIFFIFDSSGMLVRGNFRYNYFLITCAIVSVIFYLILKYLKHKTTLLN